MAKVEIDKLRNGTVFVSDKNLGFCSNKAFANKILVIDDKDMIDKEYLKNLEENGFYARFVHAGKNDPKGEIPLYPDDIECIVAYKSDIKLNSES